MDEIQFSSLWGCCKIQQKYYIKAQILAKIRNKSWQWNEENFQSKSSQKCSFGYAGHQKGLKDNIFLGCYEFYKFFLKLLKNYSINPYSQKIRKMRDKYRIELQFLGYCSFIIIFCVFLLFPKVECQKLTQLQNKNQELSQQPILHLITSKQNQNSQTGNFLFHLQKNLKNSHHSQHKSIQKKKQDIRINLNNIKADEKKSTNQHQNLNNKRQNGKIIQQLYEDQSRAKLQNFDQHRKSHQQNRENDVRNKELSQNLLISEAKPSKKGENKHSNDLNIKKMGQNKYKQNLKPNKFKNPNPQLVSHQNIYLLANKRLGNIRTLVQTSIIDIASNEKIDSIDQNLNKKLNPTSNIFNDNGLKKIPFKLNFKNGGTLQNPVKTDIHLTISSMKNFSLSLIPSSPSSFLIAENSSFLSSNKTIIFPSTSPVNSPILSISVTAPNLSSNTSSQGQNITIFSINNNLVINGNSNIKNLPQFGQNIPFIKINSTKNDTSMVNSSIQGSNSNNSFQQKSVNLTSNGNSIKNETSISSLSSNQTYPSFFSFLSNDSSFNFTQISQIELKYQQYLAKYKPNLLNGNIPEDIAAYRQAIFNSNLRSINEHNNDNASTFTMGVNLFSDLSEDEFNKQYAKLIVPEDVKKQAIVDQAKLKNGDGQIIFTSPSKIVVDWRCKCSTVISQGVCGACSAIAALETIQITMKMYNQSVAFLSIQEIISCGNNGGTLNGCIGGYFTGPYNYVKNIGVGQNPVYYYDDKAKFQGVLTPCNTTMINDPAYLKSKVFIRESRRIPYGDCKQVVNQLKTRALAIGIAAYGLQFYIDGTFSTSNTNINHGVTLVGYDPDKGYLIKNSWGTTWGKQGFGYVSQSTGVCSFAMYPILYNQRGTPTPCS